MSGPPNIDKNIEGTTSDLFQIGKDGPIFQRVIATARAILPTLLRWGSALGVVTTDSSGNFSLSTPSVANTFLKYTGSNKCYYVLLLPSAAS